MASFVRIGVIMISLAMALTIGCSKSDVAVDEVADILENQENLAEIHVYYPSTNMIIEEVRDIEKSKFGPEGAVRQIFEVNRGHTKSEPVMPDTKIIGVKVDNGTATINFDRSVLDFPAPEINQQLVVASVVKTLEQFSEIKQVKFQVEGLEKGTIDGKDVEKFWGDITLKSQPWKVR